MHKLSKFDQADLCCAHQNAIQVHPSVLGMSFNSQQQCVSTSTIYYNIIRALVHPGMPILDFKKNIWRRFVGRHPNLSGDSIGHPCWPGYHDGRREASHRSKTMADRRPVQQIQVVHKRLWPLGWWGGVAVVHAHRLQIVQSQMGEAIQFQRWRTQPYVSNHEIMLEGATCSEHWCGIQSQDLFPCLPILWCEKHTRQIVWPGVRTQCNSRTLWRSVWSKKCKPLQSLHDAHVLHQSLSLFFFANMWALRTLARRAFFSHTWAFLLCKHYSFLKLVWKHVSFLQHESHSQEVLGWVPLRGE